jgi:hypothetical protein
VILRLANWFDRVFYTPDNTLQLYFHTNATGTAMGWQVVYTAVPNPKTKAYSEDYGE